ncbi:MAG: hypothetical protein P8I03_02760 [Thalassotalea sp.]|nr:hypothetical protein [Thalassotalea sp.]
MRLKSFISIKNSDAVYGTLKQAVKDKPITMVFKFDMDGSAISANVAKEDMPTGMAWYDADYINVVCEVIPHLDTYLVKLLNRNDDGSLDIPSQSVINEWSCQSDYFKIPSHLRYQLQSLSHGVGRGYAVINKATQKVVRATVDSEELPGAEFEGGVILNSIDEITISCVFANAGVNTSYLFKG